MLYEVITLKNDSFVNLQPPLWIGGHARGRLSWLAKPPPVLGRCPRDPFHGVDFYQTQLLPPAL